jgi:hypothetical protein
MLQHQALRSWRAGRLDQPHLPPWRMCCPITAEPGTWGTSNVTRRGWSGEFWRIARCPSDSAVCNAKRRVTTVV